MTSVIVAHPEKQHSYYMVTALKNAGVLKHYETMVYYKKNNLTHLCARLLKSKMDVEKLRHCDSLSNSEVVQHREGMGLFLLLLRHSRLSAQTIQKAQNFIFDSFGKKVAQDAIAAQTNAVVMYDTNAGGCFEYLKEKAPQIVRIMDTSIANRWYMRKIYEDNIDDKNELQLLHKNTLLWNDQEMKRLLDEIQATDFFMVPSTFVKRSLMYSGVSEEKIKVVPYGVDIEQFHYVPKKISGSKRLAVLFVGQVSIRKGVKLLLQAAREMNQEVELTLVGSYDKSSALVQEYSQLDHIKFLGKVQHEQLCEIYNGADVFVLPSFAEGMARVGLEALACGIPMICSENTGVNDLIINGWNGYVLKELSAKEIENKLAAIIDKKSELPQMSINARRTAEKYSWAHYYENMRKAMLEILDN